MPSALSTSLTALPSLIALQFSSRALTFLLNNILLRHLEPATLGLSAQLELYSTSVLFFARESVRVACQRRVSNSGDTDTGKGDGEGERDGEAEAEQAVINLAYIATALGAPFALVIGAVYLRSSPDALSSSSSFPLAVSLYGAAAIVELLAEPAYVAAQQALAFKVRATAETLGTLGRCLGTGGAAVWMARRGGGKEGGVLAFAVGQGVYSVVVLCCYVVMVRRMERGGRYSLLPRRIASKTNEYLGGYISKSLGKLSITLFAQNMFKYILTQGDAMLITALTSLQDQGAYALAANYGGLIARLLFQPIEETSRTIFAHYCSPSSSPTSSAKTPEETKTAKKSDKKTDDTDKSNPQSAKDLLFTLLRAYTILSLIASVAGPPLAPLLLTLLAGPRWSQTDAATVLVSYCYYIPLLAINGVTEAFVSATASTGYLNVQSAVMGLWFVIFAAASYLFMGYWGMGASGLVWANCVNMGLRIGFNSFFIRGYFRERGMEIDVVDVMPTGWSVGTSVAVWATVWSGVFEGVGEKGSVAYLMGLVGGIGVYGLLLVWFERNFLKRCYQTVKAGSSSVKK